MFYPLLQKLRVCLCDPLTPNLRGILWFAIGTILFATVDVVVKYLGRTFHPFELAFFRYFVGTVLLLPLFIKHGVLGMKTNVFGLHFLRLGFAYLAQLCIFIAVIYLPLADATALSFSKPLFTTIVAMVILKEVVSKMRWLATGVGFLGVLLMIQPGIGVFNPIALFAIFSALFFALGNVLIRILTRSEPATRILFYYHSGGLLIGFFTVLWVWKTPVGTEWFPLILIGILTTLAMICYVKAFAIGEASAISPTEYVRLIYAATFGYFLFSELPNFVTVFGALVIIGTSLLITRKESQSVRKNIH